MKKIILIALAALTSCKNDRHLSEIHCEFNGAIVLSVINDVKWLGESTGADVMYTIKYNGEILEFIQPYPIDAHYQVGDTIKGKCIN